MRGEGKWSGWYVEELRMWRDEGVLPTLDRVQHHQVVRRVHRFPVCPSHGYNYLAKVRKARVQYVKKQKLE